MKYFNLLFLILFSCGVSPVVDPSVKLKSLEISDCNITFDADTHEYECIVTPGVSKVDVKVNSEFITFINGEKILSNTIKAVDLEENETDLKIKIETTITKMTSEYFVKLAKGKVEIDDFSFKVGDLELINNFNPNTYNYLINGSYSHIDYKLSTNYKNLDTDANLISIEVKNSLGETIYQKEGTKLIEDSFSVEPGNSVITVKTISNTYVVNVNEYSIKISQLTIDPDRLDPLSFFDPIDPDNITYNTLSGDEYIEDVLIEFAVTSGVDQAWYYNTAEPTPISIPQIDGEHSFRFTIDKVYFLRTYYIKIKNSITNKSLIYTIKFNKMDDTLVSLMVLKVIKTSGFLPLALSFNSNNFYYNVQHTFASSHKKFMFRVVYDNTKNDIDELEIFVNGIKLESNEFEVAFIDSLSEKEITINKRYNKLNNVFEFKFKSFNGEFATYTYTINTNFNLDMLSELNIYSQANPEQAIASMGNGCIEIESDESGPENQINIECTGINTNIYIVELKTITQGTILTSQLYSYLISGVDLTFIKNSNDTTSFNGNVNSSIIGPLTQEFVINAKLNQKTNTKYLVKVISNSGTISPPNNER